MAELTVQPKRKTGWAWLLIALLVIAALVYFLVIRNNNVADNEAVPATQNTSTGTAPAPTP